MNDRDYMILAGHAQKKSTCAKKHLGCLLITVDGIIIYGWNGPPNIIGVCNPCPRMNNHNGTNQKECKAVHAERRVLLHAAKKGLSTYNARLYSYMGVPCKDCMIELIEAGVSGIICARETYYDELSREILKTYIKNGGIFKICTI